MRNVNVKALTHFVNVKELKHCYFWMKNVHDTHTHTHTVAPAGANWLPTVAKQQEHDNREKIADDPPPIVTWRYPHSLSEGVCCSAYKSGEDSLFSVLLSCSENICILSLEWSRSICHFVGVLH